VLVMLGDCECQRGLVRNGRISFTFTVRLESVPYTQVSARLNPWGTEMKESKRKYTEEHLADAVKRVQVAVLGGEMLHLTHGFTGDPGRHGLVACFIVLPDEEVEELRGRLDAEIASFMEEKGHGLLNHPVPH